MCLMEVMTFEATVFLLIGSQEFLFKIQSGRSGIKKNTLFYLIL